jgi:hypothetical protein
MELAASSSARFVTPHGALRSEETGEVCRRAPGHPGCGSATRRARAPAHQPTSPPRAAAAHPPPRSRSPPRPAAQALCPICCDSVLEAQELEEPFCACGYQVCAFCQHQLASEGDASCCPNCRTAYAGEAQAALRERLEAAARARPPAAAISAPAPVAVAGVAGGRRARAPAPAAAAAPEPRRRGGPGGRAAAPAPAAAAPPARDLGVGREELWPGLPPPAPSPSPAPAPAPALARLQVCAASRAASAGPASSGGTTAGGGTPPSPASSVLVSYHSAAPGATAAGRCWVQLAPRGGAAAGAADTAGAGLMAHLAAAVRDGSLTARAAAAVAARHVRERIAAAAPPGAGAGGSSAAGSAGSASAAAPTGDGGLFSGWGLDAAPLAAAALAPPPGFAQHQLFGAV